MASQYCGIVVSQYKVEADIATQLIDVVVGCFFVSWCVREDGSLMFEVCQSVSGRIVL